MQSLKQSTTKLLSSPSEEHVHVLQSSFHFSSSCLIAPVWSVQVTLSPGIRRPPLDIPLPYPPYPYPGGPYLMYGKYSYFPLPPPYEPGAIKSAPESGEDAASVAMTIIVV